MALPWRSRKTSLKTKQMKRTSAAEISIPAHFRCPVSLDLMKDPVTASTGITYDRQSIETWLEHGKTTCPVTNQPLRNEEFLIPNHSIRKMIQDWCDANRASGIERIPTPKIPVTATQVEEIMSQLAAATRRRDAVRCVRLLEKVNSLGRESERNLRCFASNGASRVLAATFAAFAAGDSSEEFSKDILAALAMLPPPDEESASRLCSPESLSRLVSILKRGTLAARLNAALMAKELLASSSGSARADAIAGTEGLVEALAKLVKEPISPQAMKAALMAIFHLVNHDAAGTGPRAVELGLMPAVIEVLVDHVEKGTCEKALAVLEGLLSCESGREAACGHALAMPVLVKKMFRVSDVATEFVVSALWKLCKKHGDEEGEEEGRRRCLHEALQVGAFQKLLLLLQIGCSEATKEKATSLLRLLNGLKGRDDECVDIMDFKGVKKL